MLGWRATLLRRAFAFARAARHSDALRLCLPAGSAAHATARIYYAATRAPHRVLRLLPLHALCRRAHARILPPPAYLRRRALPFFAACRLPFAALQEGRARAPPRFYATLPRITPATPSLHHTHFAHFLLPLPPPTYRFLLYFTFIFTPSAPWFFLHFCLYAFVRVPPHALRFIHPTPPHGSHTFCCLYTFTHRSFRVWFGRAACLTPPYACLALLPVRRLPLPPYPPLPQVPCPDFTPTFIVAHTFTFYFYTHTRTLYPPARLPDRPPTHPTPYLAPPAYLPRFSS